MSSDAKPCCKKTGYPGQLEGLNQLRFLAAALVFSQHALSSSHADGWIDIAGFRIGRIGTALFFLLSGFFSATTTRKPLTWIKDRIVVLFPPYWVVTIAGFVMAAVTDTKTFDAWQVLSQLAGTGYFTHGDHIVNIATWFISPLLLLYAAVTTIRLTAPRFVTPLLILGLVAAALSESSEGATLHCHAVTFFMAFAVASAGPRLRTAAATAMTAAMVLLVMFQPEFRYGALASLLLVPALQVKHTIPLCNQFSAIAYEWFLVHGLCLAIVSHLTQSPTAIAAAGAILSVAAARSLKSIVRCIMAFAQPATARSGPAETASADSGIADSAVAATSIWPADSVTGREDFAVSETLPVRQAVELST